MRKNYFFFEKKKMKFYNLLVLILLFLININSIKSFLKPEDFCNKTSKKIKGCMAFDCGSRFCSFDESTCNNFISWGKLIKKNAIKSIVYKNFLSKIKNCKENDYKNQWSHRFNFG